MKGAPRVIVVDDDEDIGLVLRVVLRLDGFEVWRTISAEECLAKLKELEGKVDVIIINGSIVSDRSASLILKIERINSEIKTGILLYLARWLPPPCSCPAPVSCILVLFPLVW